MLFSDPIGFLYFIAAILITLTIHEASHALMAYYLGDPTSKHQGRITLNPIAHLDLIGSILFLITNFGWGKPVQVNPNNFKHPIRDSALTALAGPASNLLLAFALTWPIKYLSNYMPAPLLQFIWILFDLNIVLALFNFFPFPPLDGSKIIGLIVPRRYHRQYLNYLENGMQYFVAIILIDVFILRDLFNFSIFGSIIGYLYDVVRVILFLGT